MKQNAGGISCASPSCSVPDNGNCSLVKADMEFRACEMHPVPSVDSSPIMTLSVNSAQTGLLQGIVPMIPHMVFVSWAAFLW